MHLLVPVLNTLNTMQLGESPSVSLPGWNKCHVHHQLGLPGLLMDPQNHSEVCVMHVPVGKHYVIFIS